MNIILVDAFCLIVMVVGLVLLFRSPAAGRKSGNPAQAAANGPQMYLLRIVGAMMMVFGLALGLMMTIVHS